MTDHAINIALLFFGIPVTLASIIVIWDRIREWRRGKPVPLGPPTPRPWALWIFNLVGVALLVLVGARTWREDTTSSLGFNKGWPDAIQCNVELPEYTEWSPIIFYYQGITKARSQFHDVTRYFLVGGYNDAKGYGAHEVWFTSGGRMIRIVTGRKAAMVGGDKDHPIPKAGLDAVSQRYFETFLTDSIDCGGDNMDAVKQAGNAFYFARR